MTHRKKSTMVVINKVDQNTVTLAIDRMEHELHALRFLCLSHDPGHLEACNFVEIAKSGPGAVPDVQRAVVLSVKYRIKELKVRLDGASNSVHMMTDLELDRVLLRRMTCNSDDEESNGSVSYPNEENVYDTD